MMKRLIFLLIPLLSIVLNACKAPYFMTGEDFVVTEISMVDRKKLELFINLDSADPPAPDIESAGITRSMIKTVIESKLLEVGIKVTPTEVGNLYFFIDVVEKPTHQSVKYKISLWLFITERASLLWQSAIIDVVQEEDFKEMAMENLNNLLNQFLDYYLKAYLR